MMKKWKSYMVAVLITGSLVTALISCVAPDGKPERDYGVEWNKFNDPKTGYEVWQITSHDSISEAFSWYYSSVTHDDRYIIFRSKRSGEWDIYRADLTNGEIMQLTNEGISIACIHPDGEHMVYISGWKYYRMNMNTLETDVVIDFTGKLPSRPVFRPTLTADGRHTVVQVDHDGLEYIYRVDLVSGKIDEILKIEPGPGKEGRRRAQMNPADPNLVTWVVTPDSQNDMSLPLDKRPRGRIIRVDQGITDEAYCVTPYGFRATHPSWSPTGNRYFFFEKTQPGWTPVSVASIDINGGDYTRHYTSDTIKLGHGGASQDGKWFISDGQEPYDNPLILINLEDGKVKFLCWPDASINTGVHVHPNFSYSGNFIVFTSDVADKPGTHQVFMMPVKNIKQAWH